MTLLVGNVRNPGPPPIFVGGTGRSGTTITAAVLGRHVDYATVPQELRFHVDRGGIPDLLSGLVGLDGFVGRMKTFWFRRELPNGETRGLHKVLDQGVFDEAVDRFRAGYESNPWESCRVLVDQLMTSYAHSQDKPGWIEMTPDNVYFASLLARLFPDMRMVHSVRDPRGVVSSVVPLAWGPPNHRLAMAWWAERMYRSSEQSQLLPRSSLMTLFLEDLVLADSAQVATGFYEFLNWVPSPEVESYLDTHVTEDRAHLDRWQTDAGFTEDVLVYARQLLASLVEAGVESVERYVGEV